MRNQALDGSIAARAAHIYEQFRARASKDDEFHDWAGYRAMLTEFIIRNTPPGGTLLILGAGKCNDLDLGKLAAHCGQVTLSDYRPETAEEAFRRYGLAPSEQLGFLTADYVGIPEAAYLTYTAHLLRLMERIQDAPEGGSLEDCAGEELGQLQETLTRIYRDNEAYRIDLGDAAYDNAVIAGVHSQLNNSFRGLFQYVRKDVEDRLGPVAYAEALNTAIFQMTRVHTEALVKRLNAAVFAAVREGVVYGYEESILYTPEGADTPVIGTVDGARQAGACIAGLPVRDRLGCLWPLSRRRGVKFEMNICYLPISD